VLFIISGPSGSGKSTLVRKMLTLVEGLAFSVSFTTRQQRKNEKEGRDYHFVSRKAFESLIDAGEMAEWAEVHGHLYGTSLREVKEKGKNKDLLLDIDVQGAAQIRERIKEAVSIFILPPSKAELEKRLSLRGRDSAGEIRDRLAVAGREIQQFNRFDFIIINDNLDLAAEELKSVIIGTRCRLDIRGESILTILHSFKAEGK